MGGGAYVAYRPTVQHDTQPHTGLIIIVNVIMLLVAGRPYCRL